MIDSHNDAALGDGSGFALFVAVVGVAVAIFTLAAVLQSFSNDRVFWNRTTDPVTGKFAPNPNSQRPAEDEPYPSTLP